jgi:hypothetical protein
VATVGPRRSLLLAYTALLGALSIIMGLIKVPLPLGNPNLGSTPVSLSGISTPLPVPLFVGIIKGLGVSLSTGLILIELPAGIGDGIMGLFTLYLAKKINPIIAVIAGQLSRYLFTSGMIAIALGISSTLNSGLPGTYLNNIIYYWVGMIPAITLSIAANTVLSTGLAVALKKFYPSILTHFNPQIAKPLAKTISN